MYKNVKKCKKNEHKKIPIQRQRKKLEIMDV